MGAATSILVAARDPSIAGMVLDSSFSNLTQVCSIQCALAMVASELTLS